MSNTPTSHMASTAHSLDQFVKRDLATAISVIPEPASQDKQDEITI